MPDQQPEAQRYEQVKGILQKALDLTPGERAAYLDAACGADAELRAEVGSLLDAHDAAGSRFLKGPIARPETTTDAVDDDPDLTGQRVGAYRLERLIRRGGMGAVYLAARDDGEFTKHVAIKFIRPSIVTPALLKRFKVERQILADFDHPGIARLIDGGSTESGMPFFIMEYVQGEALDDVLLRGPLPQPRAIQLAVSVAEVLEAVHSKGLVYRDLKPSNIMLVSKTGVKILDFGIAKIMQGETGEDRTLTEPGWIVGSPPYMSPEQASGGRIDARSDVFSYGVVIFEALTGHLPFSGDTRAQYVRNLIAAEPEALPASVPARLRAVVDRCLKKAPAERFSSGGELAYAVRAAVAPASDRKASRTSWVAVGALALVAGVFGVWALTRPEVPAAPPLKGPPQLVATWASNETNPRISPDLRWVSFISDRDGPQKIWLLGRTSGEERSIEPVGGGNPMHHLWSPSSDRIAYVTPLGTRTNLIITPIGEGKPSMFPLDQSNAALVRWIGQHVYYVANMSLWRFDLANNRAREITTELGDLRLRSGNVDVSADERRIVFSAISETILSIWVAGIDGKGAQRLTTDRIAPRSVRWRDHAAREVVYASIEGGMVDVWLLDVETRNRHRLTITDAREGEIFVSTDGTVLLYEQTREDAHLGELDPFAKRPVVTRLTSDSLSDLLPSVSASGTEVAFQRSTSFDMALGVRMATIRVSRDGFRTPAIIVGDGHGPEVSADGNWVAYLVWNAGGLGQLWMTSARERTGRAWLASELGVRFTYDPFPLARDGANLVWSPSEARLFFVARGPGKREEVWSAVPAAEGGRVEQVTHIDDDTARLSDLQVSADGTRLSYLVKSDSRGVVDLRVFDLTRNREEGVVFSEKASFRLGSPGWTADGALVVLRSDAAMTLTDVVLVRPGKEVDAGRLRDVDRGSVALDPQRRTLYFTRREGAVRNLYAFSFDPARAARERRVYQGDPHGYAFSGIRVLPNGHLLFSFQAQRNDILSNEFRK